MIYLVIGTSQILKKPNHKLLLKMNFIVIGIVVFIFIALGAWLFWDHHKNAQKIHDAVETKGKVVDFVQIEKKSVGLVHKLADDSDQDKLLYYPVVRFILEGAKGVKFRDKKAYPKDEVPYAIGQEVTIIYEKNNPLVAKIKR